MQVEQCLDCNFGDVQTFMNDDDHVDVSNNATYLCLSNVNNNDVIMFDNPHPESHSCSLSSTQRHKNQSIDNNNNNMQHVSMFMQHNKTCLSNEIFILKWSHFVQIML